MTDTASSVGAAIPRSKFDAFLLASIGDDSNDNGMQLSVLSALARQNVDPWEQATILARLPSETATQRLTSLIAALPKGRSPRADPGVNAARLIALLPREANRDIRSRIRIVGRGTARYWPTKRVTIYVICMVVMLALQWFAATRLAVKPLNQTSAPSTGAMSSPATELRNTTH